MMTRKLVEVVVVVVARLCVRSSGGVPVVQSQNCNNFRYLSSCGAPSCTQSWMHGLQPRARGWELELGIFQHKPRPKVRSRDPPLPQSNYEKNSRHYYRVGITVLRYHDLECTVSPVVGSTVEAGLPPVSGTQPYVQGLTI